MKYIEKRRPRIPPTKKTTSKLVEISFLTFPDLNKTGRFMAEELGREAKSIIQRVMMEEGEGEKTRIRARLKTASNYPDDIYSKVRDNIHYAVMEESASSVIDTQTLRFGYGDDFEGFESDSRAGSKNPANIAELFHFGKDKARKKLKTVMFVKGQAGATHAFDNAQFGGSGLSYTSKANIKLLAGWYSPVYEGKPRFLEKAMDNLEARIPARILSELKIAYTNTIGPIIPGQGTSMKEVSP